MSTETEFDEKLDVFDYHVGCIKTVLCRDNKDLDRLHRNVLLWLETSEEYDWRNHCTRSTFLLSATFFRIHASILS